jgi:hypothetical protein
MGQMTDTAREPKSYLNFFSATVLITVLVADIVFLAWVNYMGYGETLAMGESSARQAFLDAMCIWGGMMGMCAILALLISANPVRCICICCSVACSIAFFVNTYLWMHLGL